MNTRFSLAFRSILKVALVAIVACPLRSSAQVTHTSFQSFPYSQTPVAVSGTKAYFPVRRMCCAFSYRSAELWRRRRCFRYDNSANGLFAQLPSLTLRWQTHNAFALTKHSNSAAVGIGPLLLFYGTMSSMWAYVIGTQALWDCRVLIVLCRYLRPPNRHPHYSIARHRTNLAQRHCPRCWRHRHLHRRIRCECAACLQSYHWHLVTQPQAFWGSFCLFALVTCVGTHMPLRRFSPRATSCQPRLSGHTHCSLAEPLRA